MKVQKFAVSRLTVWILSFLMVFTMIPVLTNGPGGYTAYAADTVADGSYTGTGKVSFDKDSYSFNVTVTVSGGKISNLSSTLTTTPKKSDSKTKYHPRAVSALLSALKGKDAVSSAVDAVTSGTPKYSYAALKSAVSQVLAANAGSGSDSDSGDTGSGSEDDSGSDTGTAAGTVPDGSYTGNGRVSFSKDAYNFSATVTVSGGKFTNLTSTLTSTPQESKSKSEYHPRAVSALLNKIKGKDATSSTIDAVTSGTPKYSYSALTSVVSDIVKANAAIGSGGQTGDVVITNPATAVGNDLSLSKILSRDSSDDSYTITLTGKATASSSASGYTKISTSQNYTYSTLVNGNYYFSPDGSHFYVLKGYQKEYDKYYINAYVSGKYRGLEDDGDFHKADSDRDEGDDVKRTSEVFLERGKFSNRYLYQKTGESGTVYGTSCVLKDTINTTNFDTSNASAALTSGSGTVSFTKSSGVLSVTGYDYSGNYGGKPLIVQISGLKAKKTGTIESNSGNAGIYASSSSSSPLVSVPSPKANVPASAEPENYSYTVTFKAVNGTFGDGTTSKKVTLTGSSSTLYLSEDQIPAAGNRPSSGYNAGSWDAVPAEGTAITGNMTFTYTYIKDTVDAVADGNYVDATGTVTVADTGETYVPRVTVTVSNGKITGFTATASETGSMNQEFLSDAVSGISSQIIGRTANTTTANSIDTVTGATCSSRAVIADIKSALSASSLIQWVNYDGTVLDQAFVSNGTMPVCTAEHPAKADSVFTGWSPEVAAVSGNQTYTAQFASAANTYTVTWIVNGEEKTTTVNEGEKPVSGLTPSKDRFVFAGWATSSSAAAGIKESALPAVYSNVTYYAVFTVPSVSGSVYLNSSVKNYTTGSSYYYPLISIFTDNSGKITDVTAAADDIASYSQTCLSNALNKVKSTMSGKTVVQAKAAIEEIDTVSGATNSINALKQAAVLALNSDPVSAADYTVRPDVYNFSAKIENGFSLQKTLTKETDGTYSVELRAYTVDPMTDKLNSKPSETTTTVDGRDIVLLLDQSRSMYCDFNGVEESSNSSGSSTTYTETASKTYTFDTLNNMFQNKEYFIQFSDGNYYSLTAVSGNGNGKNNYVYFTVGEQMYYLTTSGNGYTTSAYKVKNSTSIYKGKLYSDPVISGSSSGEVIKGTAKYEAVKSAAGSWLNSLGEADTVQFVGYSDTAVQLDSLDQYSADAFSSCSKNLDAGISKAQSLFSNDKRSKVMVIVSDSIGSYTHPEGITVLNAAAAENMSLNSLAMPEYTKTVTSASEESTPVSGGETMSYVLKDTVNLNTFDVADAVSSATWSAARNKVTFDKSTGVMTASGYDYAFVYWEDVVRDGNPAGTDPFKVTITGLRLKKESGSWLSASDQNAGIYSSAESQSPFISVASPLINP